MERITDYSDYKFRAHALGKLMTGVKPALTPNQEKMLSDYQDRFKGEGKPLTPKQEETMADLLKKKRAKPVLSATTKSYLNELHRAAFFGRTNHISNRYTDKGLMTEKDSMTLYTRVIGPMFKNKERRENEFISGEPDNAVRKIRDIKSSWSLETFPMYETSIPTKDYEWQLQAYMWLWEMDEAELVYCLNDTPFKLIDDVLRSLDWKTDLFDGNGEVRAGREDLLVETITNHIFTREGLEEYLQISSYSLNSKWFEDFSPVPDELRVKIFEYNRDEKMIEALKEHIPRCREYLNGLSLNIHDYLKIAG